MPTKQGSKQLKRRTLDPRNRIQQRKKRKGIPDMMVEKEFWDVREEEFRSLQEKNYH